MADSRTHRENKLHKLNTWLLIYNKEMKNPEKLERILKDYSTEYGFTLNGSFLNGISVAFEIIFGRKDHWKKFHA